LHYLFEELVPFEAGDADFDGAFHEAGGEDNAMELAEGASGDGGRQGLHFCICCGIWRGATPGKRNWRCIRRARRDRWWRDLELRAPAKKSPKIW
jgi:hypothetical protein